MGVTAKALISGKLLENAQTAQYTAANVRAIIDKATVTNVTGSNVTLSVHLVPSAGAAADANQVVRAKTILPGETYNCPELIGHVIEAGGFISTIAGTASALAMRVSGREVA
jgi:hypothetical protein